MIDTLVVCRRDDVNIDDVLSAINPKTTKIIRVKDVNAIKVLNLSDNSRLIIEDSETNKALAEKLANSKPGEIIMADKDEMESLSKAKVVSL